MLRPLRQGEALGVKAATGHKLKILVVVWKTLVVFSSITGVVFPASYSRFLSWINVVNLDIANIFPASCVLPSANFYMRLLLTTLTTFVLVVVLALTYHMRSGDWVDPGDRKEGCVVETCGGGAAPNVFCEF